MTTELKVEGMSCEMCVGHVAKALQGVPGVTRALVDLEGNRATVEHEGADVRMMIDAVEEEGYGATVSDIAQS
jgi:Cu+-exporting ATPase